MSAPIRGRCWIWTTRDEASGQVTRGVMFHEPEASRAYVSVEEYVPVPDEAAIERGAKAVANKFGLDYEKEEFYRPDYMRHLAEAVLRAALGAPDAA